MRLFVINSIGPMGSSVVSSILEKYGFINLPIRKTKLSKAIQSEKNYLKNVYKTLFIKNLNNLENLTQIGGVSVFKRNNLEKTKKIRIDQKKLKKFKKKEFTSLSELYFASMNLANNFTIYKKKIKNPKGSIELAIDSFKFDNKFLETNYKKKFKKICFINCNREFATWIETLCLVRFVKKDISLKYLKFNVFKWKKVYKRYNNNFKSTTGLNLNFEEILLPNTFKTIKKIEKFFKLKPIKKNKFLNMKFDLFGNLENFNTAFTPFDKNKTILSKISIKLLKFYIKQKPNLFVDVFTTLAFNFLFLWDFYKFRCNNKI